MSTRRASLILSILGGALVLGAAVYLVSTGLGKVGTATTDADGKTVITFRRTASILDDSPTAAALWVVFALVVAAVGVLLNRYGGIAGATSVAVAASIIGLLGALSHVGIYVVPGMACFGGAAYLSIIDRASPD
jgi:hypothetical protein